MATGRWTWSKFTPRQSGCMREPLAFTGNGDLSVKLDSLQFQPSLPRRGSPAHNFADVVRLSRSIRMAAEHGLLVEQRTLEVSTLMIMALSRDMRGVQSQILPQLDPLAPHADPHELGDEVERFLRDFRYPRVVLARGRRNKARREPSCVLQPRG